MTLSKWAKSHGYDYDGYMALTRQIEDTAAAALARIKVEFAPDSGMYFETQKLLDDTDLKQYVMAELRGMGVEFINDGELFRF